MFESLPIAGLIVIRTRRFSDARGYVSETFSAARLAEGGIRDTFVQENESLSSRTGTVRGLHFQKPPHAQAKLVRCLRGAIFDVAVDIRVGSPTFGRHAAVEVSAASGDQLYIPAGFAHGFCTLEPDTLVLYKLGAAYAPQSEGGIAWDDPAIGIRWPVKAGEAVLSDRDRALPRLAEIRSPFTFSG
jgi:dTDP-4-dehydrorhamnose 3,5-epimerase